METAEAKKVTLSPIEAVVEGAVRRVEGTPPGAAINFDLILGLVTTLFQFIRDCGVGGARSAIRSGGIEAKVAAYRAVLETDYPGNRAALALAIAADGAKSSDADLDATIASAMSFSRTSLALMLALSLLSLPAVAGPFASAIGVGPMSMAIAAAEGSNGGATPTVEVERALELLKLTDGAAVTVYDIGAGDGRVVREAAACYGVKAVGVEVDHDRAVEATKLTADAGLSDLVTIVEGDARDLDIKAEGNVAYVHLWPEMLDDLRPLLERFDRVVSYGHPIDGLKMTSHRGLFVYERPSQVPPAAVVSDPPKAETKPAAKPATPAAVETLVEVSTWNRPAYRVDGNGRRGVVYPGDGRLYIGRHCNASNCSMCNWIANALGCANGNCYACRRGGN
jgi:SAM-dependent methyltransferase